MSNFALLITIEIAAVVLEDSTTSTAIRPIKKISMNDFENNEEMLAGIYLDDGLQKQLREESIPIILTFFLNNSLFNDESTNYSRISRNVVGMVLSNNTVEPKGSFW